MSRAREGPVAGDAKPGTDMRWWLFINSSLPGLPQSFRSRPPGTTETRGKRSRAANSKWPGATEQLAIESIMTLAQWILSTY